MTVKRKLQIITDVLMTVMLPLLMAYQLIGEAVHEWIGAGMFLLFLCHHLLNRHWHTNLLKGKYNRYRLLLTGIDILLFIIMISLAASGVLLSKHVFTFLQIEKGASWARITHLLASYWGFIFMSIHLGLHWNAIAATMNRIARKNISTNTIQNYSGRYMFIWNLCLYGSRTGNVSIFEV